MLNEKELRESVELQRKSYGLLKWVGEGVRQGTLMFDQAHEYSTGAEAARDWLAYCGADIPQTADAILDAEKQIAARVAG